MAKNREILFTALGFFVYFLIVFSLLHFNFESFFSIKTHSRGFLIDMFFSVIITTLTFLLYLVVTKTKIDETIIVKKLYSYKGFFYFLLITGLVVSVIIPLSEVPDEYSHLSMLYTDLGVSEAFNNKHFFGYLANTTDCKNIYGNVDLKEYFDFSKTLPLPNFDMLPSILIVRHFPQALGLMLTSFFNLPVFICITVSEFFAALLYSLLCYKALKLMPIKKQLFACIMTLPICIQQMGSFSYDALQIPLSFLLVALIFHCRLKLKRVCIKEFAAIVIITVLLAIIKVPYCILFLLVFIIPKNKINILKAKNIPNVIKNKKCLIVVLSLIVCITFVISIIIFNYSKSIVILFGSMLNLTGTIELIDKTIYGQIHFYLTSITGNFGWLDEQSPKIINKLILLMFVCFVFYPEHNKKINNKTFKPWEKAYIVIIATLLVAAIIISMTECELIDIVKLDTSNYSFVDYAKAFSYLPTINGCQGRYFVVALPLFFIPFQYKKLPVIIHNKINYKFVYECYSLMISIYMIVYLLLKYWV